MFNYFQGWSYFSGVWNNLDILVLILCVMNISLNVYTSFVVSSDLQTLLQVNTAVRTNKELKCVYYSES